MRRTSSNFTVLCSCGPAACGLASLFHQENDKVVTAQLISDFAPDFGWSHTNGRINGFVQSVGTVGTVNESSGSP